MSSLLHWQAFGQVHDVKLQEEFAIGLKLPLLRVDVL